MRHLTDDLEVCFAGLAREPIATLQGTEQNKKCDADGDHNASAAKLQNLGNIDMCDKAILLLFVESSKT